MEVNLILLKKDGSSQPFPLPSTVTVIGRRQECDLCIPLSVISRRHCELNIDHGQLKIRDLGSKNGTFVNGRKIEEVRLKPGDNITLEPLTFVVQIDGQPADPGSRQPETPTAESEEKPADNIESATSFRQLVEEMSNMDSKTSQQQTHLYDPIEDITFPDEDMDIPDSAGKDA